MRTRIDRAVGLLLLLSCVVWGAGGILPGAGTSQDPYRIQDLADFDAYVSDSAYWDDHVRLETDLDLSGRTYQTAPIAPDTVANSQLFDGVRFAGTFDGHGHQIQNLTIDTGGVDRDFLGLFGGVASGAVVTNLGLSGVTVRAAGNFTFGEYTGDIGGLCGNNQGTIENCWVIDGSIALAWGDDGEDIGVLCGYNEGGDIVRCFASGSVTNGYGLGGLCGSNSGLIGDCWASSAVTGSSSVGGLCGSQDGGTIANCFATGAVSAAEKAGGLCGESLSASTVVSSFWDTETSGASVSQGGTGLVTAQMQNLSTYLNAGWNVWEIWEIGHGHTYPYLLDLPSLLKTRFAAHTLEIQLSKSVEYQQPNPALRHNLDVAVDMDLSPDEMARVRVSVLTPAGTVWWLEANEDGFSWEEVFGTAGGLSAFPGGDWVFTMVHLDEGLWGSTTVTYESPSGGAIPLIVEEPNLTVPAADAVVDPLAVSFAWDPLLSGTANGIGLELTWQEGETEIHLEPAATQHGPIPLKPGTHYRACLSFNKAYWGTNADGVDYVIDADSEQTFHFRTWGGSDDFADGIMDAEKWLTGTPGPLAFPSSPGGQFTETYGRVAYSASGVSGENDFQYAMWRWQPCSGSYTEDWQVTCRAHRNHLALGTEAYVEIAIMAYNREDVIAFPRDTFSVTLDAYDDVDDIGAYHWLDGSQLSSPESYTSATDVLLRITFDSSTKVLTASYDLTPAAATRNWVPILATDTDAPGTDWQITSAAPFGLGIWASSSGTAVSLADLVYVDDFCVSPVDAIGPEIVVDPVDVTLALGAEPPELFAGVTATDAIQFDVSGRLTATGAVDTQTVGNYTITYNATDTAWNPAVPKTRTYQVLPVTHVITAQAGHHGSVTPLEVTKGDGASHTFAATPNAGYVVLRWSVDGAEVQMGGLTYALADIRADHRITVTFAPWGGDDANDGTLTQAAWLAAGDEFLRADSLVNAHAAYASARQMVPTGPVANFDYACTSLFDLFERPTPPLDELLSKWQVVYERNVFVEQDDPDALASEPFVDSNENGEYDEEAEGWDDGGYWVHPDGTGHWRWTYDRAWNGLWDHEPFLDLNGNGWWDPGEVFDDWDADNKWDCEWFWDENDNGRRDDEETFTDLNGNGEWDEHSLIPEAAPSINESLDIVREETTTRIDQSLALLDVVLANAPAEWSRTIAPDMLPDPLSDRDRERVATIDRVDVQAAAAALHATKGLLAFAAGYDLDVPYDDLNWTAPGSFKTWWGAHASLLEPRADRAGSFAEAKGHFEDALGFATAALAGLSGGETNGGWLERQQYLPSSIAEYQAATADALASLAGPHPVAAADFEDLHRDIVVDLSRLFETPLSRRDLLPYDFEVSSITWLPTDPTFKNVFPEETPASWYERIGFLHNRDNDEDEADWPELADELDRDAADAVLELARGAVRFMGGYDLTADYDAASSNVDVDVLLGTLWDDGENFLMVRDAACLAEAKPLLASGLDKALLAIDQYLAGPTRQTAGYLFAEEGDHDQDRLREDRAYLDDVRRSLDGPHAWDATDYDRLGQNLTVDLRPPFENPLQRTDLLPYDFFGRDIDWLALDPTVRGILPNETRPSLYRRYVVWQDDPELVPFMNAVDDELADAVCDAADAGIQWLAGYDLRPTAGEIMLDDVAFTKALWADNSNFLTLREASGPGSHFEQGRTLFSNALDQALSAADKMLAGQGRGGIADRDEWCHLDYEDTDWNKVRHSPYHADWIEAKRYLSAWRTAMGDGPAELPINQKDPILAHVRRLFDAPPSRAELPTGWEEDGADSVVDFWRQFDWTTVPDSTLNGFFPGFLGKAHLYATYTRYFERPNPVLYRADGETRLYWCFWHLYEGRWPMRQGDVDGLLGVVGAWEWYPGGASNFTPESREFDRSLSRFEIYRKTRTASGTSEPAWVTTLYPADFGEGETWRWLVPDPPADGEDIYRVDLVFADADGSEAVTGTDWLAPYAAGASWSAPDWWLAATGVSNSWDDGDGDQLYVMEEYEHGTDPNRLDTDEDGMGDATELAYGFDPLVDDSLGDLDGDGYGNAQELAFGSDPSLYESNPADQPMPMSWILDSSGNVATDATLPPAAQHVSGYSRYAPGAVSAHGTRFFFLSAELAGRGTQSIYSRNVANGTTELVDAEDGTFGVRADGASSSIFLAANENDGRYVLFASNAPNLNPGGTSDGWHFYLRDLSLGTTRQLPIPSPVDWIVQTLCGAITPDGSHLVVETYDGTGVYRVYHHDRETNQTVLCGGEAIVPGLIPGCRLGIAPGGIDPLDRRREAALSEDGRYVFIGTADSLIAEDTNFRPDVYRYAVDSGTVERVSIDPLDAQLAAGNIQFLAASADGRLALLRAAVARFGEETVPKDYLLLRDMERQRTVEVYAGPSDGMPYTQDSSALLSRDGRYVAFSVQTALDGGAMGSQLWLFERTRRESALIHSEPDSGTPFPADVEGDSVPARRVRLSSMSEDGRYVFFRSRSSQLAVDGNPVGEMNLYRHDTLHQRTEQINLDSRGEAGRRSTWGWPGSETDDLFLGATRDGRWVVLASEKNLANERQWQRDWASDACWSGSSGRSLYLLDLTRGEVVPFPGGGNTDRWSASWDDGRTPLLAAHAPFAVCPLILFQVGDWLGPVSESMLMRRQSYVWWEGIKQKGLGCVGWLDSDGDGLSDRFEKDFGLSLSLRVGSNYDDGDGLDPTVEEWLDLDPTDPDSDGDGIDDGLEFAGGTDPNEDDAEEDPDEDGLTNAEEFAAGLRPILPDRSWRRHIAAGWGLGAIPPDLAEENRTSDVFRRDLATPLELYRFDAAMLCYVDATAETLEETCGYWLLAGDAYDLDLTPPGTRRGSGSPVEIKLEFGWNLVSIPGHQEYPDVWTVFLRHPTVRKVWKWDAGTANYVSITEGDLDCLEAYWVYASEETVIVFEPTE